MTLRTVTIRYTMHDMTGDETVEVWLKRGAGAWALDQTVDVGDPPTQDFELNGLESDVEHVVQVRAVHEGRYRAGYLDSDPELWPDESRFEFTAGGFSADAPTITDSSWARTSGVSTTTTIEVTPDPDFLANDLELLRDGVVVDTVAGPHVGPVDMLDVDPPLGVNHAYTARHVSGGLHGTSSAATNRWAGPNKPTALAQTGGPDFGQYTAEWTVTEAGATTRVSDHWIGAYQNRVLTAADAATALVDSPPLELDSVSIAPTHPVDVNVRVRHEVTAFAVTDVSDWTADVVFSVTIADDETAYNGP